MREIAQPSSGVRSERFRYVLDPLCIESVLIYLVGRWYLRPQHIGGAFTQGYLNDVLCLPLFLPVILMGQRLIKLRNHDHPPKLWEMLQHWVIFSIVFEVIIPRYPAIWRSTADPLDVIAYLAGGLVGWIFWNRAMFVRLLMTPDTSALLQPAALSAVLAAFRGMVHRRRAAT
jgi:hypothetical protein